MLGFAFERQRVRSQDLDRQVLQVRYVCNTCGQEGEWKPSEAVAVVDSGAHRRLCARQSATSFIAAPPGAPPSRR